MDRSCDSSDDGRNDDGSDFMDVNWYKVLVQIIHHEKCEILCIYCHFIWEMGYKITMYRIPNTPNVILYLCPPMCMSLNSITISIGSNNRRFALLKLYRCSTRFRGLSHPKPS